MEAQDAQQETPAAPAAETYQYRTAAWLDLAGRRKRRKKLAVAAVVALVVAAGAFFAWRAAQPSELETAAKDCHITRALQDGGTAIDFDTKGTEDAIGDDVSDVACVLLKIHTPQHVISHIDSTRALDGQQTDSWEGYTARWTYHPTVGMHLNVVAN